MTTTTRHRFPTVARCPGCGTTGLTTDHAPGDPACAEVRRERDIAQADD